MVGLVGGGVPRAYLFSLNVLSMKISVVWAFGIRGGETVGSSMSSISSGDCGVVNTPFPFPVVFVKIKAPVMMEGVDDSKGDCGGEGFFRGGGGRGRGTRFSFFKTAALFFRARSAATALSSGPWAKQKIKKHGHFFPGQETSAESSTLARNARLVSWPSESLSEGEFPP